MRWVVEP